MKVSKDLLDESAINKNIAHFGKRSSLLITSHFIKLAVQLLILYWYARMLSVEEYGRYQLLWLVSNIVSVFGLFGLPLVLLSYPISSIKKWIQTNPLLFSSFLLLLHAIPIVYLLLTTAALTTAIFWLIVVMALLQHVSIIAETIAIKERLEKRLLIVNILYQLLFFGVHAIGFYTGYELQALIMGLIIALILKIGALWVPFNQIFIQKTAASNDLKIGAQWLFLGLNDILGVLFKWVDKWFILLLVSVSQFAIYFNGSYGIPIYALMLSAVGSVMLVDMARNKSKENIIRTLHHSGMLLSSVVFPSFAYLLFYHGELFTWLFSEKYKAAIPIFFVTLWVLPLRITHFTAALQVHQRTAIILKGSLYDLISALILMAILYPLAGLTGLALAFVLSTWMQGIYYAWHTAKVIQCSMSNLLPFAFLSYWLMGSITVLGIHKYLWGSNNMLLNAISGAVVCGILIILMLLQYRKKSTFPFIEDHAPEADNL